MQIELSARISEAGEILWDSPARLKAWLLPGKGQPVYITLDRAPRRSLAQNRRYHGGIVPFAQQVWENERGVHYTRQMAHFALKIAFHPHGCDETPNPVTGEIIFTPKSTRKLSTKEFSEYCDACEAWIFSKYGVKPDQLMAAEDIA